MGNSKKVMDKKDLTFVFSCSSESDVGEIACKAGRRLATGNHLEVHCIPGAGLSVSGGYVQSARSADRVLVIDGCAEDCTRKTLDVADIHIDAHLRVTDLGLQKDETPVTEENINQVVTAAQSVFFGHFENSEISKETDHADV